MEVIVEDCRNHPTCPHGPCLMFERRSANGSKTGRKFYACSARRARSLCAFFHWADEKISAQKKKHWDMIIKNSAPPFSHGEFMKRFNSIKALPVADRIYCKTCSLLILPEEKSKHKDHERLFKITDHQLQRPTELFQNIENKKAEAQYFFNDKTIKFVSQLLVNLGFTKLLLIGTPKIREYICKKEKFPNVSTLLLDIDQRYLQFLSPDQFCYYNMFNNYFFGGEKCEERVKNFLSEENGGKVAVLIDPPFGGLANVIVQSLQSINQWWRTANSKEETDSVPLLWFFPYFLEPKIIKNYPELQMMDYKVEYSNHKKFGMSAGAKGSAVRIFTNIPASSFVLPENEGYRFCKKCQRYVSEENSHCQTCKKCTTKHGKTYKHCDSCQRCVKSSYVHCDVHNKCSPKMMMNNEKSCACNPSQDDENEYERCFKCFGYGHRKRECPKSGKKKKKQRK